MSQGCHIQQRQCCGGAAGGTLAIVAPFAENAYVPTYWWERKGERMKRQ